MRMKKMIQKANDIGFQVSFDEVLAEAARGIDGSKQPIDVLSRPHLARVLVKKGYVKDFETVFDEYLADDKPLHAYRFTLDIDEWVQQAHDLTGLVIWAHPFHGHDEKFDRLKQIGEILIDAKIDGVERIYDYKGKYKVSEEFIRKGNQYLDPLIRANNWLVTAGGDFHGNVGKLGELDLPEKIWEYFLEKLNIE